MKLKKSLVLILAVSSLMACSGEEVESPQELVRPVKFMRVADFEKHSVRKFPGEAKAANEVTLAFEVTGKLSELPIDVGQQVKKGDVLALLDPRDYENALQQAEAELLRSKAQFQRVQTAIKDNAVSRQELTDAQAAYESARAIQKIRKKALQDTVLVAPYDAMVVAKYQENFSNINAKQPIVRLIDHSKIEMISDIPEDLISLVEEGMEIAVSFDAFAGKVMTSYVHEIGNEASETTGTYPVTLVMEQPEWGTILPGMTGNAWRGKNTFASEVPTHMKGHEIPLSAVYLKDNKKYVWVISETEDRVILKSITTGELTSKGVLVQGLEGSERIVTAGVNNLEVNQKVRLLRL